MQICKWARSPTDFYSQSTGVKANSASKYTSSILFFVLHLNKRHTILADFTVSCKWFSHVNFLYSHASLIIVCVLIIKCGFWCHQDLPTYLRIPVIYDYVHGVLTTVCSKSIYFSGLSCINTSLLSKSNLYWLMRIAWIQKSAYDTN